jgi:hypothetical protein
MGCPEGSGHLTEPGGGHRLGLRPRRGPRNPRIEHEGSSLFGTGPEKTSVGQNACCRLRIGSFERLTCRRRLGSSLSGTTALISCSGESALTRAVASPRPSRRTGNHQGRTGNLILGPDTGKGQPAAGAPVRHMKETHNGVIGTQPATRLAGTSRPPSRRYGVVHSAAAEVCLWPVGGTA